ncbi:reverse transcriptase domain-containing protein [Tanacetum coccineum]
MRTRSSGPVVEPSTTPIRRRNKKHSQQVDPTIVEKPVVTMADTRTMAELLQAPTEGYGDAIVIPAILVENFELKHGSLNLVTSKQFCGFEKEDPHAHIRWFNKITFTIKYKDVRNSSIKLMLFPFSIEGAARIWLEKEPLSLYTDQYSLNAAAGGNLLTKTPKDALTLIENKSKVRTSRNRPVVAKALLLKNTTPHPASVKAVEESCVTCGGPHPYYQCLATDGNAFPGYQDNIQAYVSAAAVNYNQGNAGHRPPSSGSGPLPSKTVTIPKGDLKAITTRSGVSYDGPPILPPLSSSPKVVEREPEVTKDMMQPSTEKVQPPDVQPQAPTFEPDIAPKPKPNLPYPSRLNNQKLRERDDHQMMKFLQIFRSLHFDLSFTDALLYMPKFASTFKNLLSNKEKLFELANTPVNENCSAVILKKLPEKLGDPGKFLILCNFPEIVECLALADLGASINLMPLSIWRKLSLLELTPTQMILELADRSTTRPTGITEEVFVRVGKFHYIFWTTCSVDYVEDLDANPTPISEPIIAKSSPSLTLFEGGDFILEEIETYLASDPVPPGINDVEFDPEGDICLIEEMLNNDPYSPLPPKDLRLEELKTIKSSVDEPPELELKDLPSHLEYAFLEGTDKLPSL